MITPMKARISNTNPNSQSVQNAPNSASGSVIRMASGWVSDSNSAAISNTTTSSEINTPRSITPSASSSSRIPWPQSHA